MNGEHGARLATPPFVPEPETEKECDRSAHHAGNPNGAPPDFCFDDGFLTCENRDIDAVRGGLGFAEGRTHVTEKFHALGTNRFLTDVTGVDGQLAGVLDA